MTDSIQVIDDNYMKRLHGNNIPGRLYKGASIAAASSSIPTKYQTIVINNADRRGFQSCSKRFSDGHQVNENPGPGNYVGHAHADKISPSYSKKGTGGFASKDHRILKYQGSAGPGPLRYALPSMLVTRKDFNRACATSTFHRPIAVKNEDKIFRTPAPTSYTVNDTTNSQTKANNVTASAAFKSRSKREILNNVDALRNPAPGQYDINDEQTKTSISVPMSSFKSRTQRKFQDDRPSVPGPGTYQPYESPDPVNKVMFPKKHYLCISAPAMPLPNTPPAPGPGAYELINHEREQKHYMSGAAFVSSTSRWSNNVKDQHIPGPAHYRPINHSRPNFIYNASGRWI